MQVRRAEKADYEDLASMRRQLYPGAERLLLDLETEAMLKAGSAEVPFVVETDEGSLCGFAYAAVRSYAEGCKDGPAAYLEGIWIALEHRRSGAARALLAAVELWARGEGHSWLASDALLENRISQAWHRTAGFEEVERSVHYRKPIR